MGQLRGIKIITLLVILFTSCSNQVLFLSDSRLELLQGKFYKERILSFLRFQPVEYHAFSSSEELEGWMNSSLAKERYHSVLISSIYLDRKNQIQEKIVETPFIWLNADPQKTDISIYSDWNQLSRYSLEQLSLGKESMLVLYGTDPLSIMRKDIISPIFRQQDPIVYIKMERESYLDKLNSIRIDQYQDILLLAGDLNYSLMVELEKWEIPFSGEVKWADTLSFPWKVSIDDNWSEIVKMALKQASEDTPQSIGIAPLVQKNPKEEQESSE